MDDRQQPLDEPCCDAIAAAPDPAQSARTAGLRYVSDNSPGISRHPRGSSFTYRDADGKVIRGKEELKRIHSLVIPPAWTKVWICPSSLGHIQAVGRDARGRKQYRYHPRWREVRDETKYARMMQFVRALPKMRRRTNRDLKKRGLTREKVLAAVVRLLETTLIRIGNEEYANQNHSFGLTTLRNHHAEVHGSAIAFHFRGKSGVKHEVELTDPRLAKIVEQCQDLPGCELFEYRDEAGGICSIKSEDVNDYLREIAGEQFTAKDFRTWAGTVLAAKALQEFEAVDSQAQARKNVLQAIESVAKCLGNTRAVCRKCYIHPTVIDAYLEGSLLENLAQRAEQMGRPLAHLRPEEAAVLVLLQRRLKQERGKKPLAAEPRPRTSRRRHALAH